MPYKGFLTADMGDGTRLMQSKVLVALMQPAMEFRGKIPGYQSRWRHAPVSNARIPSVVLIQPFNDPVNN